jgi:hypothetical protein
VRRTLGLVVRAIAMYAALYVTACDRLPWQTRDNNGDAEVAIQDFEIASERDSPGVRSSPSPDVRSATAPQSIATDALGVDDVPLDPEAFGRTIPQHISSARPGLHLDADSPDGPALWDAEPRHLGTDLDADDPDSAPQFSDEPRHLGEGRDADWPSDATPPIDEPRHIGIDLDADADAPL